MTEKEREILRNIPVLRMQAKSELEKFRYMMSETGRNFEREINDELDKISRYNKLEEELMKKKY
jgi:hypothetical protein